MCTGLLKKQQDIEPLLTCFGQTNQMFHPGNALLVALPIIKQAFGGQKHFDAKGCWQWTVYECISPGSAPHRDMTFQPPCWEQSLCRCCIYLLHLPYDPDPQDCFQETKTQVSPLLLLLLTLTGPLCPETLKLGAHNLRYLSLYIPTLKLFFV